MKLSLFHQYFKKERWLNVGRLVPFLLFSLFATSIFSYLVLNSPNPSFATPNQNIVNRDHAQNHPNLIPETIGVENDQDDYKYVIDKSQTENEEKCDLFKGHWVPDMRGSLYSNWSCPTIPISKNCFLNERVDRDFLNWRWKPDNCELARFEPKIFLNIVRGKKLAFIGDSVARNQMESLLCLLSQEETPKDIYKDSKDRFRTWYFPTHDFTLMVLWTKYLVQANERQNNGTLSGIYDIHLDKIDAWAQTLPQLDYAIISGAHWFFRKLYIFDGNNLNGCVYCNNTGVNTVSVSFALKMAFRRVLNHIKESKECKKDLVTLIRTFSPSHFENGYWNTGGGCNRTSPTNEGNVNFKGSDWELRNTQVEEIERVKRESGKKIEVLDITRAMLMRPDGHPGLHWDNQWMKGYSDCTHWCLPGPIDVWNDLLLAILRK